MTGVFGENLCGLDARATRRTPMRAITATTPGRSLTRPATITTTSGTVEDVIAKADTKTLPARRRACWRSVKAVTLNATVTAVAPGSGTPTGTVTFTDDGNTLGMVTLSRRRGQPARCPQGLAAGIVRHRGRLQRRRQLQQQYGDGDAAGRRAAVTPPRPLLQLRLPRTPRAACSKPRRIRRGSPSASPAPIRCATPTGW